MKMKSARSLLWASTILGLAIPVGAQAQTSTAPAARGGDEIVVTARRREERAQDVPVAVTALGAAQLERANITDINSMQGKVPNLLISPGLGSGNSTPVFAIRGLSQQDLTHLSDPSVSLYFNDIAVPRPIGANLAFFDIASVQVLRGPQGTLFGRNTTGGAVLVTSAAPTSVFEGSIAQTIGNFDAYRTEAVLNTPIGNALSVRFSGLHNERGGWITDVNTGGEINTVSENGARLGVDFHPADSFRSLTTFNYAKSDNGGTGGFARPGSIGGAAQALRDDFHTASGVPMHSRVEVYSIDNTTSLTLSNNITLKNIVGYRHLRNDTLEDTDGSASFILPIQRFTQHQQLSEEFQVQGDYNWGNFIAGYYYFRESGDDHGVSAGAFAGGGVDPGAIEPNTDLRAYPIFSDTSSTAVNVSSAYFAQGTFKMDGVAEGLSATVGLRQNMDERNTVILNHTRTACRFTLDLDHNPATPEVNPGLAGCQLPLSAKFDEPTYNVSLDYHPTPDILLYIASRHGYRTGGFGARASTEQGLRLTFRPETVNDVEIGVKADWRWDNQFLRTNLAMFHASYKDIQRLLNNVATVPPTTTTTNAGAATINGIELEVLYRPVNWLELSGFYARTDARFTKFIAPDGTDLSPFPFARAPANIGSATVRVNLPMEASLGDANMALTYLYQDEYNENDTWISTAVNMMPSYDQLNFNAEWNGVLGSNGDLALYVDNVTDEEHIMPLLILGAATVNAVTPSAPRTYGVRLKYHFGG